MRSFVNRKNNHIIYIVIYKGLFSTGAMGALAPAILGHLLLSARVSTRIGKIILSLSTRNFKILNTPLNSSM